MELVWCVLRDFIYVKNSYFASSVHLQRMVSLMTGRPLVSGSRDGIHNIPQLSLIKHCCFCFFLQAGIGDNQPMMIKQRQPFTCALPTVWLQISFSFCPKRDIILKGRITKHREERWAANLFKIGQIFTVHVNSVPLLSYKQDRPPGPKPTQIFTNLILISYCQKKTQLRPFLFHPNNLL